MIRSQLVTRLLRDNPELTREEVDTIVRLVFATMADRLAAGGRVELRDFGVFYTRAHEPRRARNPRNGAAVDVGHRRMIRFRSGREIHQRIKAMINRIFP